MAEPVTAIRLDESCRTPAAGVVGHRFTLRTEPVPGSGFDGVVAGEVLAVERGARCGSAGSAAASTPR
jgi:hypothetical protein